MRRLLCTALLLLTSSCVGEGAPGALSPVEGSSTHAAFVSPNVPWAAASGQQTAALGLAVAGGGDINDDGHPDALLGVPGYDDGQSSEGGAFLFLGDGTSFSLTPDWIRAGDEPFAFLGASVAHLGDVNNDGFDDVALGAWQLDGTAPNEGAVLVFHGSTSGLAEDPDWSTLGTQAGASHGFAVAGGDFNGDDYADLAVGAPGWDDTAGEDEGRVVWYAGGPGGLSLFPSGFLLMGSEGAGFGYSVASAGDVNADGFDDLLVGAPTFSDTMPQEGQASLFLGGGAGLETTPAWTSTSGMAFARLGHSVDGAGDVNGDGFDDLLVGVPYFDDVGPEQGQARIFFGSDVEVAAAPDWIFLGPEQGALAGIAVSGPGDLDGDGIDDVLVGASHADVTTPDEGMLYVFAGLAGTGPSGLPGRTIAGGSAVSFFGSALSGAGDTNDDGFQDILVGAWSGAVAAFGEGTSFLLYGVPATVDVDNDGFCADPAGCAGDIPGGDCNDLDPFAFPGAEEVCDGVDQDCDGALPLDEQDNDSDGFMPCEGDCSDTDASVNPDAEEQCDDIDHDCDGLTDNGVVPPRYWIDADGDGHGNPLATPIESCTGIPTGYSALPDDCDDSNPAISPSAPEEYCNGEDEDCSFLTPDVPDRDGDAFTSCDDCQTLGTTLQCGDCDDTDQEVNPYMAETCSDGIDQDCDGTDPECALPPECDEPDNVCEELGCACSHGHASGPGLGALLALLLLPLLGWTRRQR